jgi:hypothetical protein
MSCVDENFSFATIIHHLHSRACSGGVGCAGRRHVAAEPARGVPQHGCVSVLHQPTPTHLLSVSPFSRQ